ncbi:MAG: patatin family protein [Saccharofermentans sp.]|nr:patatin family protein [Saccharofermentans sp.]
MKKGLVLEGGAMRGLFTAGVLDLMLEKGIEFDGAAGVSAGAAFGCNYKSKQIGRALRYNKTYCRDWRYCSFRSWLFTGDIYGAKFCYYDLPFELDIFDTDTYTKNPMEFYVVATECGTGKAAYYLMEGYDETDRKWMRASASMPGVSKPVKIGDKEYLDGGISDSIPLEFMQSRGYDRNIVVLTQPDDYVKKPLKIMPLMKVLTHKTPNVYEALDRRPDMYNAQTEYVRQCEKNGDTLVIRPEASLEIGSIEHNPDELQRVYDIGRQTAKKRIDEIEAFMSCGS